MDISLMTIRLVLLFIPGVIGTLINNTLVDKEKKDNREFLISTILYGIFAYTILSFFMNVTLLDFINTNEFNFNNKELLIASAIASVSSVLVSFASNKEYIYKLINKMGISDKFGWDNVFQSLVHDRELLKSFILIRDIKNSIMYEGFLSKYSKYKDCYELYLINVSVYNNKTGKKLYDTDRLYFKTNFEDVTMEVRAVGGNQNDEEE